MNQDLDLTPAPRVLQMVEDSPRLARDSLPIPWSWSNPAAAAARPT